MSEGVIGRDHVNVLSLAQAAATESVNLGAVAAVLEFWNTHDIDGVLRFYDPEIVWHNMAMEENYARTGGRARIPARTVHRMVPRPRHDRLGP